MRITVQVPQQFARALREKSSQHPDAIRLLNLVRELSLNLVPLHPGTEDPQLSTYFTAEVVDEARAHHVAEQLRRSNAVVAAYLKPPDAPA